MAAVANQLRDAAIALLAGHTFSQAFTPTPQLLKEYDAPGALRELRVEVVATAAEFSRLTRATRQQRTTIEIGILKKVGFDEEGQTDQVATDALQALAEEIATLLVDPLPGFPQAGPVEPPEIPQLFIPELQTLGIFASVVRVIYLTQASG